MQKKHLHLFLLFLVLAGCGRKPVEVRNEYLEGLRALELGLGEAGALWISLGETEIRLRGAYVPSFDFRPVFAEEMWSFQWLDDRGEPLELTRRANVRSLTAVGTEDSVAGFAQWAVPLPEGCGAMFFLEGEASREFRFALSAPPAIVQSGTGSGFVARGRILMCDMDNVKVAVFSRGRLEAMIKSGDSSPNQWRFRLRSEAGSRAVGVVVGREETAVRAIAERHADLSREALERRSRELLQRQLAFSLYSESDSANQVFALLAAALSSVPSAIRLDSPEWVEESAQYARGLWLLKRDRRLWSWMIADTGSSAEPNDLRSVERTQEILSAALDYGMESDSLLRRAAHNYLQRLLAHYPVHERLELQNHPLWNADSLFASALESVRRAACYQLAEDLSWLSRDQVQQGQLRSGYLEASREAKRAFKEVASRYAKWAETHAPRKSGLTDFFDPTPIEEPQEPVVAADMATYPDTVLFLRAGARYGFNWLADNPSKLWDPRRATDPFIWQRWVAYQFRNDFKTMSTPDYDSLQTMVLAGRLPGFIPAESFEGSQPSLIAMSAALENLAELYLGVRPNGLRHQIFIEPRLPASWGHTTARIPYGEGFIAVDYDFARNQALVEVSRISGETEVFFGYPLESGGFARTQFRLNRTNPAARITMERDQENRVRLYVDDTP